MKYLRLSGIACLYLLVLEFACRYFGMVPTSAAPPALNLFEPDSLLGWRAIPQSIRVTVGDGLQFNLTSFPNNTRSVGSEGKPRATPATVILGDSAMWGWGVDDSESLAGRLSTLIPSTRFLNAAVPGYGVLQSTLQLSELLKTESISRVIVGVGDYLEPRDYAELGWIRRMAFQSPSGNITLPFGRLKEGRLDIVPAAPALIELPLRRHLGLVRMIEVLIAAPAAYRRAKDSQQIEEQVYRRLAEVASRHGIAVTILDWRENKFAAVRLPLWAELGFDYAKCIHPLADSDEGKIPNDGHPRAEIVASWADCLKERLQ